MQELSSRLVIIGQAPSRSYSDGEVGRSGARIASLLGISYEELDQHVDWINLVDRWPGKDGRGDTFPLDEAREKLAQVRQQLLNGRRCVLLGRKVAEVFGLRELPYFSWIGASPGILVAIIPHPSGLCRFWNNPANSEVAAAFLRRAVEG